MHLAQRHPQRRGNARFINAREPVLAGDVVRVHNVKANIAHPRLLRLGLLVNKLRQLLCMFPVSLVHDLKEKKTSAQIARETHVSLSDVTDLDQMSSELPVGKKKLNTYTAALGARFNARDGSRLVVPAVAAICQRVRELNLGVAPRRL